MRLVHKEPKGDGKRSESFSNQQPASMNEWMGMLIKYNSTDNNTPSTSSHSLPPSKWQRRTPHICQRTENGKRMKPKSAAAEEKNRAIFQFNLSQSDSWNISLSKCLIYPKGVIRYNIPLRFIYLVLDYDIPLFPLPHRHAHTHWISLLPKLTLIRFYIYCDITTK